MNRLDESTLLAYVDDRLDTEARAEVETMLASDEQARELVARLRTTPANFREVFDATLEQPLAPRFAETLLHREVGPVTAGYVRTLHAAVVSLFLFAAGSLVGYLVANPATGIHPASVPDWVAAVVDYQVLYGRDTLDRPDATAGEIRQVERRLSSRLGVELKVPDLQAAGMAFKRGQLLDFRGAPVAQLAYLPDNGKPFAYCVVSQDGTDSAPVYGKASGLNYSYWYRDGFGHIVIGTAADADIRQIVDRLLGQPG